MHCNLQYKVHFGLPKCLRSTGIWHLECSELHCGAHLGIGFGDLNRDMTHPILKIASVTHIMLMIFGGPS